MGDRLRIVVIGLPELGYLLEETAPAGADVVTIPRDADVAAELASRAKGATRETMLFVVADTGEPSVDRLPDTLARGGFRAVVLAGLPGAVGTYAAHESLRVLSAPFTANDVLAALSGLPGDTPFFLPIEGGDRTFGEAQLVLPPFRSNGRRERNGVVFPARPEHDEDPLGPPVADAPLPPLPSPPPPPVSAPLSPPSPPVTPGEPWPPPPAGSRLDQDAAPPAPGEPPPPAATPPPDPTRPPLVTAGVAAAVTPPALANGSERGPVPDPPLATVEPAVSGAAELCRSA